MWDAAIRADAGSRIGWGHVKRCLALGRALQTLGARLTLVARDAGTDLAPLCDAQGVALVRLPAAANERSPEADAEQTLSALRGRAPALVVVDHYGLDARWHEALRSAGSHIAVIDDLADRPLAADGLVDPNPHPDHAAKYAGRLTRAPQWILGGPRHALLDAAYADAARQPPRPLADRVQSIGIFLGGGDAGGHSAEALHACRAAGFRGPVEIATTRSNPWLEALSRAAEADGSAVVTLDQPTLVDFHRRHDLEIGGGGGASWERCCLGVPSLALICADNQEHAVRPLAAAGVALAVDMRGNADTRASALALAIGQALADPQLRRQQRQRGQAWVDGRGAVRVARALHSLRTAVTESTPS